MMAREYPPCIARTIHLSFFLCSPSKEHSRVIAIFHCLLIQETSPEWSYFGRRAIHFQWNRISTFYFKKEYKTNRHSSKWFFWIGGYLAHQCPIIRFWTKELPPEVSLVRIWQRSRSLTADQAARLGSTGAGVGRPWVSIVGTRIWHLCPILSPVV